MEGESSRVEEVADDVVEVEGPVAAQVLLVVSQLRARRPERAPRAEGVVSRVEDPLSRVSSR